MTQDAQEHATSGSDKRESRQLSGHHLLFNLGEERRGLAETRRGTTGRRTAKTLAKDGELRVTLVSLAARTELQPEARAGGACLLVLDGRVRLRLNGQDVEAGKDDLLVLGHNLRDPILAVEDATFLLTVAWPAGEGASEQERQTGHQ